MHAVQILTKEEVGLVLADLTKKARDSKQARINLTIFRLSAGCGLRRMEISGLNMKDVVVQSQRPVILVRSDNTKGREGERKERFVPLDWDRGTLEHLTAWKAEMTKLGFGPLEPFICSLKPDSYGKRICKDMVAVRWRTAIKCLGPERVEQLASHSGRRTFASHAHKAGHSLKEIQDALGHAGISTTSKYLYVIPVEGLPDMYDFSDGEDEE
jgi:integrase